MSQGHGSSLVPLPIKVFLIVAVVGGISGVLIVMGAVQALWIVLGGFVFVGLLLLGYKALLGAMSKTKSRPFEKQIRENARKGGPGLAGEARIQALQDKFAEGLDVFRKHGKDMYALPWYLLVGEPGSGKTEAIRHCNVGFPSGLQDTLQGLGGTMNMNWWFTNYAVILDTAGRLMFEEVAPGETSEWREFLKQLRTARPNSPVNGLLLVIPADSLIKDTEEQIEQKAARIAQQLNTVRDSLKVRFPAFVIVTKSDLINGFREFYDSIDDPSLQHQMMGWSNPSSLDERFEPRRLGEHFTQLSDRIRRRRMALLLDPVHTEDPNLRRIDQVDALYAYPEAMTQIVPRLQKYLETVFSGGAWSGDPLFLRGIYFTSSMREGSALDADLAAAIGVPVDALPEGRTWKRERAFFLRDMFISKVFRERGLVLKSASAKATRAARQLLVLGSAGVTALLLIGLTVWGAMSYRSSIGQHLTFWEGMRNAYITVPEEQDSAELRRRARDLVVQARANEVEHEYLGKELMDLEVASFAREQIAPELLPRLEQPIEPPLLYKPLAPISADYNELRASAFDAVFVSTVFQPVVYSADVKMQLDRRLKIWNKQKLDALLALIWLEVGAVEGEGSSAKPKIDFKALTEYAVAPTPTLGQEASADGQAASGTATGPVIDHAALRRGVDRLLARGAKPKGLMGTRRLENGISEGVRAWLDTYEPALMLEGAFAIEDARAEAQLILDAFNSGPRNERLPNWAEGIKRRVSNRLLELDREASTPGSSGTTPEPVDGQEPVDPAGEPG